MKKLLLSLVLINATSLLQAAHLRHAAVKCMAVNNLSARGLRSSAHRKPISTPVNIQTLLERIDDLNSNSQRRENEAPLKYGKDSQKCRLVELTESHKQIILSVLRQVFRSK